MRSKLAEGRQPGSNLLRCDFNRLITGRSIQRGIEGDEVGVEFPRQPEVAGIVRGEAGFHGHVDHRGRIDRFRGMGGSESAPFRNHGCGG